MKFKRSFISILLCLALILTSFAAMNAVQVAAADSEKEATGNSYSGELILQCWNWPISVIQSNLDNIKAAGFTAIQTSPVNGIIGSGNRVEDWYQFYQPVNYSIGNKIGTENDFKNLCTAAHNKNLKVLVDVVLNHTSDNGTIASELQNIHSSTSNVDYNNTDRRNVTQNRMGGLPDINTANTTVQNYAKSFLNQLVADGADGFRFDAAKHIELPEDDSSYRSNFWPNVVSNNSTVKSKFNYGEVLGGINYDKYMNYMKVTGNGISDTIKNRVSNYKLPAGDVSSYGYDPDDLVCYVETHDAFQGGNYAMSNYQIQLGWAALAAQGGNCVYMARPSGSTPSYTSGGSDYKGTNYVYDGGDGAYFYNQVKGVNKFHNAMNGQASYVDNIYNSNGQKNEQILVVRRGNKGVCFVNAGGSDFTLNNYNISGLTGLNGTYKDGVNGESFTITSSGNVSGTIKAGKIYTLYSGSGDDSGSSGGSTSESSGETTTTDGNLYLSVPSTYEVSSPNWYIWTWGTGSGKAVKGVKDSTSGYYKFTDFDSNVIFLRVANGKTFDGSDWTDSGNNAIIWNKTGDLAIPSGKNLFTITGWGLDGTWGAYAPPAQTHDYNVTYYYYDSDGGYRSISTKLLDSELTDKDEIAAQNDPSSTISNTVYKYSIGSTTMSGTNVSVTMTRTANEFNVNVNGTLKGKYTYLQTADISYTSEKAFFINGDYVKTGKSLTVYVTGDMDVEAKAVSYAPSQRDNIATVDLMSTYISDTKVNYELLATANVSSFKRMGVAFAKSAKTSAQLAAAINNVTSGTSVYSGSNNKIAVHNSTVDYSNDSGLYQFRYGPSVSISNIPSGGATLYFYTFAVTADNQVVTSTAKPINVANTLA